MQIIFFYTDEFHVWKFIIVIYIPRPKNVDVCISSQKMSALTEIYTGTSMLNNRMQPQDLCCRSNTGSAEVQGKQIWLLNAFIMCDS
jgi:hypothetical protein